VLNVLANPFKARRDLRELGKLRWIAQTINQHLQSLTLIKVGSRIQRTLEDETRQVDLVEIDTEINRMTLRAMGELARKYMRLADGLEKTEEEVASVIAMCILSSWLRLPSLDCDLSSHMRASSLPPLFSLSLTIS
jgi:hypothetical protein